MIQKIAVLGPGQMGSGIAQHAAACGYDVILWGRNPEKLEKAVGKIMGAYDKQVAKGRMEAEAAEAAKAHITATGTFEDIKDADIVIEAISEEPALKKDYFTKMEAVCKADSILATNTSSISITEIAAAVSCPERVIGMHFFSPVPVMKLVEIIMGEGTDEGVYADVKALCDGLKKVSVKVCKDTPGFIVNRVLFAYFMECIHIYEEGIASKEDIDNALKFGLNHPMGPFALMDMGGLDTFPHVCESLQTIDSNGASDRFACPKSVQELAAAGKFGMKSGEGWYKY